MTTENGVKIKKKTILIGKVLQVDWGENYGIFKGMSLISDQWICNSVVYKGQGLKNHTKVKTAGL